MRYMWMLLNQISEQRQAQWVKELKTLISNELQPFSDTGITREMLRNSFQAKRPPKAVLKNDFVWVRILNQSRIFVKHSETSKDPLVPH